MSPSDRRSTRPSHPPAQRQAEAQAPADPQATPPPRPASGRPGVPTDVRVAGQIEGYEVTITLHLDSISRLFACVRHLREQGLTQRRPLTWEYTADNLPICPRHHVVMRRREKQGDVWHSHAVTSSDGEELYCRGYPGPDSPGFAVAPERGGEVGT